MSWQPIETAPKDGSSIMLCVAGYEPTSGMWFDLSKLNVTLGYSVRAQTGVWLPFDPEGVFDSDADLAENIASGDYKPTHWMPLPSPPDDLQE